VAVIVNHERRPFATLRTLAAERQPPSPAEACELCGSRIALEHWHLLELATRKVACACQACAILFSSQVAARYRRIPRRVARIVDFALEDQQWDSLLIPINLAYFFHHSGAGKVVVYYPSPAGATESLLDLEYWTAVEEQNPIVRRMEPDVEALLVRRNSPRAEYYLAPIDQCYRLVGLMRAHWHGFYGGSEVWKQIDGFFAELKQHSSEVSRA
jgi:hypothetical protein